LDLLVDLLLELLELLDLLLTFLLDFVHDNLPQTASLTLNTDQPTRRDRVRTCKYM